MVTGCPLVMLVWCLAATHHLVEQRKMNQGAVVAVLNGSQEAAELKRTEQHSSSEGLATGVDAVEYAPCMLEVDD